MKVFIYGEEREARKEVELGMEQKAIMMVQSAIQQMKYIAVHHEWFAEYVWKEMEKIYD